MIENSSPPQWTQGTRRINPGGFFLVSAVSSVVERV